jgi:hypothetical protein
MIEIVLYIFNPSFMNVSACERRVPGGGAETWDATAQVPGPSSMSLPADTRRATSLAGIGILKVLHDLWRESPR